ncbi:hypothetical protein TrVE_jg4984 [Triparma verrucosa]|uniref:Uncharacterized protein n=1 Tax=Triparma verrucosa TaxID=1606542 RepID=A0A9W7CKW9_9STRA|nr:hypothetical protein TrVE_jg4984 [Triparma verrucosa]
MSQVVPHNPGPTQSAIVAPNITIVRALSSVNEDESTSDAPHILPQDSTSDDSPSTLLLRNENAKLKHDINFVLHFMNESMKPRKMASHLPSVPKSSSSSVNRFVSHNEVTLIAKGFDYLTKTIDDEGDAVGKFMTSYPVIEEVNGRHHLLEELLIRMSVRLASDSRNYAAIRLFLGVVLSTFDTATDMFMYFEYKRGGDAGYANATLATLLLNLGLQLLMSFFQNRKMSPRRRFFEALYVLTFVKPGIDAYRVAIGAEQEIDTLIDPKTEMVTHKGLELFTEAIPGTLIQMYAFFAGSTHSSAANFSLLTSVITASFTATGISYDLDTDRYKRQRGPEFYGYIPGGSKRMTVVTSMFGICVCQLGSKAFVCALCAVEDKMQLVIYILVDLLLFFVIKMLCRDFTYWPAIEGTASILISVLMRTGAKIITDFTGLVHLRHPYELGGAYWVWTLLSTPIVGFFFGSRYLAFVESEEGKAAGLSLVLQSSSVYGIVAGLYRILS